MINRRIIRIKILQMLFAYYQSNSKSVVDLEKELNFSYKRFYDLYYYLFLLLIDINDYARIKQEKAKKKYIQTDADLNPNTKFVNNKLISQLRENIYIKDYLQKNKMSWVNNKNLIKKLYTQLTETEKFNTYINSNENSYREDKHIVLFCLNEIIYNNEELFQVLEEQSIFWCDNVEYVIEMVSKSLKKFSIGNDSISKLMPKFKNDIDFDFSTQLLRKSIINKKEYKEIIQKNSVNWDYERLAFIDIIIIQIALSEILNFPEIPIKVTFNEYIELSKIYSTSKSGTFINGILDKIVVNLKKEGKINKIGRGLV